MSRWKWTTDGEFVLDVADLTAPEAAMARRWAFPPLREALPAVAWKLGRLIRWRRPAAPGRAVSGPQSVPGGHHPRGGSLKRETSEQAGGRGGFG
jgi:hypothetical protein